jgi:single-strand DNA-binding protein
MKNDLNSVQIAGNLTRDPELKTLDSGTAICNFSIANNRDYKKDGQPVEKVTFIDCQAWGKTGEIISQFFTKGKPILLEGENEYSEWTDKDTGKKRSKVSIKVSKFYFLNDGKKSDSQQSEPQPGLGGLGTPVTDQDHIPPGENGVPF